MRRSRMLAIGVTVPALGLAVAATGTAIPAQAAPAVHYVALGDSYSSGVGAGDTSGSCAQSPNAYPALWAKAHSPTSFTFAACSGATTSDVINGQLSSLSDSTTLVSITIGGNDAGFAHIMETCVLDSTSSCESAIAAAEKYANDTLPGLLNTTLADIHTRAPNAKVVVSDYPEFYDLGAWLCLGLSSADHQALDNGIGDLDGVLQTAAAKDGDTFADVRSQFSHHELCSGSDWLHAITVPIDDSYHPNADGQKDGYLPPFTAAAASVGQ
ncbi:MAG: SGNH/GDSL hydrolase family protein [Trebonia sp.]